MPPSGFSQEAINGLLEFVRDSYQNTIERYKSQDLSEENVLQKSLHYLDKLTEKSISVALDGTVSEQGIKGLQKFVSVNFKDLINEINSGKKKEGKAMQAEIKHIGSYLKKFKI